VSNPRTDEVASACRTAADDAVSVSNREPDDVLARAEPWADDVVTANPMMTWSLVSNRESDVATMSNRDPDDPVSNGGPDDRVERHR